MPKFETEIIFPHSVQNIYEMVLDIEKYPQFLPNCSHLLIKKHEKSGKNEHFLAEMGVKFSIFSEKFDSNVVANEAEKTIKVSLNSGPIKNLNNDWSFINHPKGCLAKFLIEVEMNNFALRLALAGAFKIGATEITNAFVKRADSLFQL